VEDYTEQSGKYTVEGVGKHHIETVYIQFLLFFRNMGCAIHRLPADAQKITLRLIEAYLNALEEI
jgi:hypothetical protein